MLPSYCAAPGYISSAASSFLIALHRLHAAVHAASRQAATQAALDCLESQQRLFELISLERLEASSIASRPLATWQKTPVLMSYLCVLAGSGWVCDKGGRPQRLNDGDVAWCPPGIPSVATMLHFSALAFLSAHKSHEFMKLRLSNLIIMAEPTERRSMRLRKSKIHFDDQTAQYSGPSKPLESPKSSTKPTIKPSVEPNPRKGSVKASTKTLTSTLDLIEELCSQTKKLDIQNNPKTKKAKVKKIATIKKKIKIEKVTHFSKFNLNDILKEVKTLKDI